MRNNAILSTLKKFKGDLAIFQIIIKLKKYLTISKSLFVSQIIRAYTYLIKVTKN